MMRTNPRDLLGFGTWEQVKDTFLLAAGDTYAAGETGGEAEHTLSKDEIPDHTHYIATVGEGAYDLPPWTIRLNSGTYVTSGREGAEDAACGYSSVGVGLGGQAHNNLPPYLAVFVWARTA